VEEDGVKRLHLHDLFPRLAGDLADVAYGSLAGDCAYRSPGRHGVRNPNRRDMAGLTKAAVEKAALQRDMAFFEVLYEEFLADPWHFSPSLRTYIPKDRFRPKKGTRPIDDPCELKRLIVLYVRQIIEGRAEGAMTSGQYGGRPMASVKASCPRKGATMQDHVVWALWEAAWGGYGHVLLLDLKDAFGLVPKKAALKSLQGIGLDEEAARWIWRLVRMDAVDARNRKTRYTRQGRGIEQGNALSATIMNLVLAPVLRTLEARHDVKVYAYLDDIYVAARSHEVAHGAFYTFRQSARDRGFTNVRPFRKESDLPDSKNSTIINVADQPVPVLKTYMVDRFGISLHPDKEMELWADGELQEPVTIKKLRKLSNCQALMKHACRERNCESLRPSPIKGKDNKPLRPDHPRSASAGEGVIMKGHQPSSSSTSVRTRRTQGVQLPGNQGFRTEVLLKEGVVRDDRVLGVPSADGPCWCSNGVVASHGQQAGGISPPDRGDSHQTDRGKTRDRRGDVAEDRHPCLSILSPEIMPHVTRPGRLRFGDRYKGWTLDLRGLEDVLGEDAPDGLVRQVVNGLVRVVRQRNKATVIVDPRDAWTGSPGLIGNEGDEVYKKLMYRLRPDGAADVALVRRPRGRYVCLRSHRSPFLVGG
jgi:hypothetical protein